MAIAIGDTIESVHVLGARSSPVEGTIIKREQFSRWGIPAGKLTVQIPEQGDTVTAITNTDSMKELPAKSDFTIRAIQTARYSSKAKRIRSALHCFCGD